MLKPMTTRMKLTLLNKAKLTAIENDLTMQEFTEIAYENLIELLESKDGAAANSNVVNIRRVS